MAPPRAGRGFAGRGMARARGPLGSAALARMVMNNANFRQQLGITDAQVAKVRQLTTDYQTAQIRSRADLQVNQLQLRNLLAADTPDRNAINKKLEQISAVQLTQRKQQVGYTLDMRNVLTAEQKQKLQQLRQNPPAGGGSGQAPPPASAPSSPGTGQ